LVVINAMYLLQVYFVSCKARDEGSMAGVCFFITFKV
jgi:hypothetical protein